MYNILVLSIFPHIEGAKMLKKTKTTDLTNVEPLQEKEEGELNYNYRSILSTDLSSAKTIFENDPAVITIIRL